MDDMKDAAAICDAAISELEGAGVDFSRSMGTSHFLYLPTQDAAIRAGVELLEAGFEILSDSSVNEDGEWCVIASDETIVVPANMRRVCISMETLALELGGRYDGWETAIHMDENDPLCPLCDEFRANQ